MSGDPVIAACQAIWPRDKSDCSAFARDVAAQLGVRLAGDANAIVDAIRQGPWTAVQDGPSAAAAAQLGKFVIAGLRGNEQTIPSPHGHVVVVVNGPLANDRYPSAYWGRLGGVGAQDQTINYAWRDGDRDRVTYAYVDLPDGFADQTGTS